MTLRLQKAKFEDARFLWKLRNDTEVRKQSFDSRRVTWSDHKNWLEHKLKDKTCELWMIKKNNIRAGQIRFDHKSGTSLLSVSLEKKFRGKGYGVQCLRLAVNKHRRKKSSKAITAYVKKGNDRSILCFKNAGFRQNGSTRIKKQPCLKFVIQK